MENSMMFWSSVAWPLLFSLLIFLRTKFSYWQTKSVKTLKCNKLTGNWLQLKSMHYTGILQDLYDRYKGHEKLAGFYVYTQPIAVILDLDLVKSVLIKDFNKFVDRMSYKNDKDILAAHLFNLAANKWRPLRNKLTPTFTAAKMKYMFPTIIKVAQELEASCDKDLKLANILNITNLTARYTTDVIGTCAFGMSCNSLKDPRAECYQIATKTFGRTNFNVRWHIFKQTYTQVMRFIGFKRYPQFIEDFFMRVLKENVMEREKMGIRCNDFVDLLIDLKNTRDEDGHTSLSDNEITAQLFIFFVAGFETASANMTHALYLLARHPEQQDKLRKEIAEKLEEHNNELTYEAVMKMTYLDQVISETLRLYPVLSHLSRVALEDYTIPDTDITLHKGTTVFIPVRSIHYDPQIYENPQEFRPERFHPSEMACRHPQSFLGFGDGPRNCIGLRFGRLQVRIGLVALLTKYKFSVCEQTVEKFEFSDHSITLRTLDNVWLKVEKFSVNTN